MAIGDDVRVMSSVECQTEIVATQMLLDFRVQHNLNNLEPDIQKSLENRIAGLKARLDQLIADRINTELSRIESAQNALKTADERRKELAERQAALLALKTNGIK